MFPLQAQNRTLAALRGARVLFPSLVGKMLYGFLRTVFIHRIL